MPYYNHDIAKEQLSTLVTDCYKRYGQKRTAALIDEIKELGFKFVTRSGLSICLDDTKIETDKDKHHRPRRARGRARQPRRGRGRHRRGRARAQRCSRAGSRRARRSRTRSSRGVGTFNPIWMMITSGARASITQFSQITGMRGLMSDPFGRLIEDLPVKNNLHDGLNLLEYFVSTHGARKGLADTALRTADAGT
jgi:DNA-directed RNA polymerase subunit beta'